jgi:hypothetical protein
LGGQSFAQHGQEYHYAWWLAAIDSGRPYPQEQRLHDNVAWFRMGELRRREDLSPNLRNLLKKLVDGEVSLAV